MRIESLHALNSVTEGGQRVYSPRNKPTKADVGLSLVPNQPATSSTTDSSNSKFATAGAVKTTMDRANSAYSLANSKMTQATADGRYLGKTAKASSAIIADSAGNADKLDGLNSDDFIRSNKTNGTPVAAYYLTGSGDASAGTKIRLPYKTNANKMLSFTVRVYQSYSHYDIKFSGYLYSTPNQWYSPNATLISGSGSIAVKMGKDADGRAYVWVAGGSYRGVAVLNVIGGYQSANWNTGWEISVTNTTPNVALTATLSPPYSPHNKPSKADIGLSNVPNYGITSSTTDSSNSKFATAGAVKAAMDKANSKMTQATADGRYLGKTAKAADSNLLDGIDSSRIPYGINDSACTALSDFNANNKSGFIENNGGAGTNRPGSSWVWGWQTNHSGGGKYGAQGVVSQDGHYYFRVQNATGAGSWRRVMREDISDGRYLAKSGGSLTGSLVIKKTGSFKGLQIETNTSWAYQEYKSGGKIFHIAFNDKVQSGDSTAPANALHFRPNGNFTAFSIDPDAVIARKVLSATARLRATGNGNDYAQGGVELIGNGSANTVFPTIGFHQPGKYASSLQLRAGGDFRFYTQGLKGYANVTAARFIGKADKAATSDKVSVNTSTSKSFYGLVWNSGTTLYTSANQGLVVRPSDGFTKIKHGYLGNNYLVHDTSGKFVAHNTNKRSAGVYGVYDSTRIGHVWSMGVDFKIHDSGTNFGNLYGLAYKHTNNKTGGTMAGGHQMVWCTNGSPRAAMGDSGIWTAGTVYEGGNSLSSKYLGKTAKAVDADKLDGINSSSFLRSDAADTMSKKLTLAHGTGGIVLPTTPDGSYPLYLEARPFDGDNVNGLWCGPASDNGGGITLSNTGPVGSRVTNYTWSKNNSEAIMSLSENKFRVYSTASVFNGSIQASTNGTALEVIGKTVCRPHPANGNMYPLEVQNNSLQRKFWVTATGVAYSSRHASTSDVRWKENIKVVDSPLETVSKLRGVTYDRPDLGEKNHIGFIAQELQKVLPGLVDEVVWERDEYIKDGKALMVNYEGVIPVLVEALKEEKAEREKLEIRLSKLEELLPK